MAEVRKPYQFHLTDLIENADWGNVPKPPIFEYIPFSNPDSTEEDPILEKYEAFFQIIVVQFVDRREDDLGYTREDYGDLSADNYSLIIKHRSYNEIRKVVNRLFKIMREVPTNDEYNRIEFPNPAFTPRRDGWIVDLDVTCRRPGKPKFDD